MTETSDETNPDHPRPTAIDRDDSRSKEAVPDEVHRDPASALPPDGTDDIDAHPPGLYVDSDTGEVPEPNEPG